MKKKIEIALDNCIEELRKGANIEACLNKYPHLVKDLKPLLEIVQVTQTLPKIKPDPDFKKATKERILSLARNKMAIPERRFISKTFIFQRSLRPALAFALIFFLLTGGVTFAATKALPGSLFYPVKRVFEKIQMVITTDPAEKIKLSLQLVKKRLREASLIIREDPELAKEAIKNAKEELKSSLEKMEKIKGKEKLSQVKSIYQKEEKAIQKALKKSPLSIQEDFSETLEYLRKEKKNIFPKEKGGGKPESLQESKEETKEVKTSSSENEKKGLGEELKGKKKAPRENKGNNQRRKED